MPGFQGFPGAPGVSDDAVENWNGMIEPGDGLLRKGLGRFDFRLNKYPWRS